MSSFKGGTLIAEDVACATLPLMRSDASKKRAIVAFDSAGVLQQSGIAKGAETMIRVLQTLRDGHTERGTVVFVYISGLKSYDDGAAIVEMLTMLHAFARDNVDGYALTSANGIILVLPGGSATPPLECIEKLQGAWDYPLPLKLGVTWGAVATLTDVDGLPNLIGVPINIAARLAVSACNTGCLVHSDYAEKFETFGTTKSWLHPRNRKSAIAVPGKQHDEPYQAYVAPVLPSRPPRAGSPPPKLPDVPAVLVAYDLYGFSQGDLPELRARFASVVQLIRRLNDSQNLGETLYLSPGGDGGVLAFARNDLDDAQAASAARLLQQWAEQETKATNGIRSVKLRVGVHSGHVLTYTDAYGMLRPTGKDLFIADEIAGDEHARRYLGTIMTREVALAFVDGSESALKVDYVELEKSEKYGFAARRYTKRDLQESAAQHQNP